MGRPDVKLLLGVFCNDHFDYIGSRYRLFLFDCRRVAAERKERRLGRGFRRSGEPDGVWPAGCGFGSFPGDHLVRNHLHAHLNHAFDLCSATIRANIRAFGSEADADEIAARDSGRAVRTADRSAKPGAHTEIEQVPDEVFGRGVLRQEGILFPFHSYGGSGAVAWNDDGIVGQGQDAVVQGAHDFLERSSREIGASDAAGEQGVAGDQ